MVLITKKLPSTWFYLCDYDDFGYFDRYMSPSFTVRTLEKEKGYSKAIFVKTIHHGEIIDLQWIRLRRIL